MPQLVLQAGRTEHQYWRDIWRYRELFYVLAWRDVSVKYKQTAVGILWALIQPLTSMLVMTFVFGRMANLPSGGVPYALIVFAGMLPWTFISNALTNSSTALLGNSNLISKVYFPRMIIPASAVVTSTVDFAISFVILLGLMLWYRYVPPVQIVFLPLFIVMAFFTALGPGLILTALTVRYRDFRFILPFIVQFGVYVSPVAYLSSNVAKLGDAVRLIYSINPAVGVIDGFRWCILGGANKMYWPGLFLSLALTGIMLFIGISYFRRTERSFADVI